MKTFESTTKTHSFLKDYAGSVVAIGNYDGVHFGHQEILKKAKQKAKDLKLPLVVLSFLPHPVKVLAPEIAPSQIQTPEQKAEILKELGVDVLIFQKFSKDFAKTNPQDFFQNNLVNNLKAKALFVGYDFTFGKKRQGTTDTLETFAQKQNIDVNIIPAKIKGETLVSSTLIRKLIQQGQIEKAKSFLTRFFFIDGFVIPGFQRGTALGIHTANLQTKNELIPQDGVYATRVIYKNKTYDSVTNIGFNPTFENTERSIETHIFDFDQEIYDQALRLIFIQKIRNEIKFVNPQALVKQIGKDIEQAKKILKEN